MIAKRLGKISRKIFLLISVWDLDSTEPNTSGFMTLFVLHFLNFLTKQVEENETLKPPKINKELNRKQ